MLNDLVFVWIDCDSRFARAWVLVSWKLCCGYLRIWEWMHFETTCLICCSIAHFVVCCVCFSNGSQLCSTSVLWFGACLYDSSWCMGPTLSQEQLDVSWPRCLHRSMAWVLLCPAIGDALCSGSCFPNEHASLPKEHAWDIQIPIDIQCPVCWKRMRFYRKKARDSRKSSQCVCARCAVSSFLSWWTSCRACIQIQDHHPSHAGAVDLTHSNYSWACHLSSMCWSRVL